MRPSYYNKGRTLPALSLAIYESVVLPAEYTLQASSMHCITVMLSHNTCNLHYNVCITQKEVTCDITQKQMLVQASDDEEDAEEARRLEEEILAELDEEMAAEAQAQRHAHSSPPPANTTTHLPREASVTQDPAADAQQQHSPQDKQPCISISRE